MTRAKRKRSEAPAGTRPPVSETIAPPPLAPGEDPGVEGAPAPLEAAQGEEVQLDLSLAVPEDTEEPLEVAAGETAPLGESAAEAESAPHDEGADAPVLADPLAEIDDAGDPETFDAGAVDSPPGDADAVEAARDLTREHLRGLLEALVFAADKPMTTGELARMASAPVREVRPVLAELKEHYAPRGVVLDEVAGGWVFRTSVQFAPFVRELTSERPVRLTRAQVETLAIAAYRQPITRPEIDEIRGVDSGATLKLLLERDLVRILGKKDEPGRPLLYGTTTHFLEFFGLKSLKDLPTLREFTELSDESRRVAEAELGEVLGDTPLSPPSAAVDDAPPPQPEHSPSPDAVADRGEDAPADAEDGEEPAHDTMIPSAPPTGEVEDPDLPSTDESV